MQQEGKQKKIASQEENKEYIQSAQIGHTISSLSQKSINCSDQSDQALIINLENIYLGASNQIVRKAQAALTEASKKNAQFINKMLFFLLPSAKFSDQFKQSASIMLKKVVYNIAQLSDEQCDKSPFLREFYTFLKMQGLSPKVKQQISICIEYILNKDQKNRYRKQFLQRIISDQLFIVNSRREMLSAKKNNQGLIVSISKFEMRELQQIHGLMFMNVSFLNSLVEIQDIAEFFLKMANIVPQIAFYLIDALITAKKKDIELKSLNSVEGQLKAALKTILLCQKALFQYIQLSIERIFDQSEMIPDQVKAIISNNSIRQIFHIYLNAFKNSEPQIVQENKKNEQLDSIIFTGEDLQYSEFSLQVKQKIVQCLFHMYQTHQMPQDLFGLLFITFLSQSVYLNRQRSQNQEKIICRIMEILENQLVEKFFYSFYISKKYEIIFTLFLYSVSSQSEIDDMCDFPDKFSDLSEEYTEGYSQSTLIKVRAGCFLKTVALNIDEAPKNILQICIVLMTSLTPNHAVSAETVSQVRAAFNKFAFCSVPPLFQLQTIFMVLCLLTPIYAKREESYNIVCAIISTNSENFARFSVRTNESEQLQRLSALMIARIIRLLGYYPMPPFYSYIQAKMGANQACMYEGMKSFERILKQKQYPQIYSLLGQIFIQMLDFIKVSDGLAQSLFLNNYEKIIIINRKLFEKTVKKLIDAFIENHQKDQHIAILALNFICSLMAKQKDLDRKNYIQGQVSKILQQSHKNPKYEEQVIEVYFCLLKESTSVDQRVLDFAESKISEIEHYGNNSLIYKFYNELFMKMDNSTNKVNYMYATIFSKLLQQSNLSIIPHLSLLMSQIVVAFREIHISDDNLIALFQLAQKHTQNNRTAVVSLILSFFYVQPVKIRSHLINKNLYQQALKLILEETSFQGKLHRKIFVLGMVRLLEVQEKYFKDILLICAKYLRSQLKLHKIKTRKTVKQEDPKLRRVFQMRPIEEEQTIEDQNEQENIKTNDFWDNFFRNYKHPINNLSQFDQFKIRVWQNSETINDFSENQKQQIRQLMDTDWLHNKARRVYRVKKDLQKVDISSIMSNEDVMGEGQLNRGTSFAETMIHQSIKF